MILELQSLQEKAIRDDQARHLGIIDRFLIDPDKLSLLGFQVQKAAVLKKFYFLPFADVLSLGANGAVIENSKSLRTDLKDSDHLFKKSGSVIGVKAVTESGKHLGKVTDLLIEAETGLVVRLMIRHLLSERIIPRDFVVSISPRQVVFKDVVDTPIFNQLASNPTTS